MSEDRHDDEGEAPETETPPGGGKPGGEGLDDDGRFSQEIHRGLGFLSAMKDALEETLEEARGRGDLSADKARSMVREALERARDAADEAKERFDFARQEDLERLQATVQELKVRLENLESRVPQDRDVGPSGPSRDEEGEAHPP